METIEVRTNIMYALNETLGEANWKVDTLKPKKILTVFLQMLPVF